MSLSCYGGGGDGDLAGSAGATAVAAGADRVVNNPPALNSRQSSKTKSRVGHPAFGGGHGMGMGVILRRVETPDEVREMPLGRFEVVHIGRLTVGRATYQPGWRWSQPVGPGVGAARCSVEHVGLVVSGVATAAFADGRVF